MSEASGIEIQPHDVIARMVHIGERLKGIGNKRKHAPILVKRKAIEELVSVSLPVHASHGLGLAKRRGKTSRERGKGASGKDRIKQILPNLEAGKSQSNVGWSLQPVDQVNLSQVFSQDPDFQSARLGTAARSYLNRNGIKGLYVLDSTTGSPAKNAKLFFGDLITSIEGTPVKSVSDVCDIVQSHGPGDKLLVRGRYLNSTSTASKILTVPWRTQVTLR